MNDNTIESISKQIRSAGLAADQNGEALPGGVGDNRPDEAFDPAALAKGIKVEMEHTQDPAVAKEIAKDHLSEDPAYYDKLEEMEKSQGVNVQVFARYAARTSKLSRFANVPDDQLVKVIEELAKAKDQAKQRGEKGTPELDAIIQEAVAELRKRKLKG